MRCPLALIALIALIATLPPSPARAGHGLELGKTYVSPRSTRIEVERIETCIEVERIETCIEGSPPAWADDPSQTAFAVARGPLSCTQRRNLEGALKVYEMFFTGLGVIGMCSGVGSAVGITAGSLVLGTQVVSFAVSNLPCDPRDDDERIRRLARREVCEVLVKQGFQCDPDGLQ